MSDRLQSYPENLFPPAMPTVTFDVGLRNLTHSIDFDYNAFYEMAQEAGLNDDDVSSYSIHFSAEDSGLEGGEFDPKTRTSTISIPACIRQKPPRPDNLGYQIFTDLTPAGFLNDVVMHETGHYRDFLVGGAARREAKTEAVNTSIQLGTLGALAYLATTHSPESIIAASVAGAVKIGRAVMKASTPYTNLPQERPAFAFQEQYAGRFRVMDFSQTGPELPMLKPPSRASQWLRSFVRYTLTG